MNGDEMNSASMLMNLPATSSATPTASPAVGADTGQAAAGAGGFDQAMAAAQASTAAIADPNPRTPGPASLALVAGLFSQSAAAVDSGCARPPIDTTDAEAAADATDEAAQSGAAAILIQMLGSPSQPVQAPASTSPDVLAAATVAQSATNVVAKSPVADSNTHSRDQGSGGEAATAGQGSGKETSPDAAALEWVTEEVLATPAGSGVQEKSLPQPAAGAQGPSTNQTINAQAAVQATAAALRDTTSVSAAAAPMHSSLREPVGTARWADELGNRLVLMSVRGQQQGSLTLTPEHLGPMEVQISVNRDTASVWFGAQHADTRAALVEAMPRLREMLASSGLSLGQSGVSEQAPRDTSGAGSFVSGDGSAGADTDAIEVSAPAWRSWRPGLIDTYA